MKKLITVSIVLAAMMLIAVSTVHAAVGDASATITNLTGFPGPTCGAGTLLVDFTGIGATDDDGGSYDNFALFVVDANGVYGDNDYGPDVASDGTPTAQTGNLGLGLTGNPTHRMWTVKIWDIPSTGGAPAENSQAGIDWVIANGVVIASQTFDAATYFPACASLPGGAPTEKSDDRINAKRGDDSALLYARKDAQGKPVLHLYCLDAKGNGYLGEILTQEMFDKAPAKPSTNTKVGETSACRVPIKFYVLTTGEYQVNIGPDYEGKVDVIVFTGLPPANIHYYRLQ